jgi:hypothetical protein
MRGGGLIGCAKLGAIEQTSGEIVELSFKRISSGEAWIGIRNSEDPGNEFFSEYAWDGGAIVGIDPGVQQIMGVGTLLVTE